MVFSNPFSGVPITSANHKCLPVLGAYSESGKVLWAEIHLLTRPMHTVTHARTNESNALSIVLLNERVWGVVLYNTCQWHI